jgi:hypothetical protein
MRLGRPASLRLCRSLLPLAFDLEKSNDMVGARREARASRAHPTSKLALSHIGGPALCAESSLHIRHLRKGTRASRCSHVTLSTGQPLPAYLRWVVASRMFLVHTGSTRPAGSSRLASGTPPAVARERVTIVVRSERDSSPNGFRLQLVAMLRVCPACLLTSGRRDVRRRPR